jgi:curved DNA-binding protein CbpA
LLAKGVLTRAALTEVLGLQLQLCVRRIFTLDPSTSYAFYDTYDALKSIGAVDAPPVDPYRVLWHALLETPPREHLEQTLAQARDKYFRLRSGAELEKFMFDERMVPLIDRMRERPLRLADLQRFPGVDTRDVETFLYLLLITKHAHAVVPSSSERGSVPPPAPTSAPQSPVSAPVSMQSFVGRVPASDPEPSVPRVSVASVTKAKDGARTPPSVPPDLAPEYVARWEEVGLLAATIDKQDYFQMLGVSRASSADQVQGAFLALAKKWHPDRLPAALAPLKEDCGRIFARLGEAQQTLLDPERRDRYMTLLADGGATPEDQESIAAVVEAATNFQKAEVFLKKNDLVRAELFCARALDADPQPDYLALLAWLESLKPENQTEQATLARVAKLDRAVAQSKDRCERAFFYRGMLYKKLQNTAAAVRDFRRAAELNPRNLDAIREVRLYELRKSKGGGPEKSAPAGVRRSSPIPPPRRTSRPPPDAKPSAGFFGRLFKK